MLQKTNEYRAYKDYIEQLVKDGNLTYYLILEKDDLRHIINRMAHHGNTSMPIKVINMITLEKLVKGLST